MRKQERVIFPNSHFPLYSVCPPSLWPVVPTMKVRQTMFLSIERDTVVSFCYVQSDTILVDMNNADGKAGRGEDQTTPLSPLFFP